MALFKQDQAKFEAAGAGNLTWEAGGPELEGGGGKLPMHQIFLGV